MIAFVTGATGFVGRNVVEALRSRDVEVRCLVRTPGKERLLGQGVDVHYGSVQDPVALRAAIYGVDAVVHLVAVIKESGKATFQSVNVDGTRNVMVAAKAAGAAHFVQMSAIGATDDPRFAYLYSKWQGEQAVIDSGLPHTILRPSILFGAGDEFINSLAGLVKAFPVAPVIGSGKNVMQPIAVEDVARCVAETVTCEKPRDGVVEIGGPDHLSYNEIVDIVAETFGVRRLKVHVPVPVVRRIVELMETLLPRPPATTEQLRMIYLDNATEPNAVEEAFGFVPKPLRGNIDYVRSMGLMDGLRILMGSMPRHIRDH